MPNISSLKASSRTLTKMSSSVSPQQHSFSFYFVMSMAIVILFLGNCPSVSSSPTPSSPASIDHNNKVNYESNGYMFDSSDYQAPSAGDSSLLSPTVQQSLSDSSPFWYAQPRNHANQFLMSHVNDNDIIVPKCLTRYNTDDQTNNSDDLVMFKVPTKGTSSIYVDGVPIDSTEREVAHIFRVFPGFQEVRLIKKEAKSGRKFYFCFVDFENPLQATIALQTLQGYRFDKNDKAGLKISYAFHAQESSRPKSNKSSSKFRRRN